MCLSDTEGRETKFDKEYKSVYSQGSWDWGGRETTPFLYNNLATPYGVAFFVYRLQVIIFPILSNCITAVGSLNPFFVG